jgi:Na+/H+ antiporter NhaC
MSDQLPAAPTRLAFHGGAAGALAPFALFVAGVAWLALHGAPDEKGFWPVLVAALGTGLLLAKDRRGYAEAMLDGMARRVVALMILAWLFAGVLAALLGASGVVAALADVARGIGLGGGGYVAAASAACAVVSMATGTSFGTILLCGPLLYPAGGAVGAAPAPLLGAILAGATFGDSLSPVSDTTIASSTTQGVDIGGSVRQRLRYAIPAGLVALIISAAAGGSDTGAGAAPAGSSLASPGALAMLLAPALVLVLLFAGRHLVEGLLAGIACGVVLGLVAGRFAPSDLLAVDPARFGAGGLLSDGLQRGVGVSVFTLLLMALVGPLTASGLLDRLVSVLEPRVRTARAAEASIVAAVLGAALLTTHSVVAILTVGDLARRTGETAGVGGYRRANLLDLTVCTAPFLLPYFLPPILAASVTRDAATHGMPALAPWDAGRWNTYAWALLATVAIALVTGWGRGAATRPPAAPAADAR